jgi:pimeloyl-ACP methyl ester carboxylesterase
VRPSLPGDFLFFHFFWFGIFDISVWGSFFYHTGFFVQERSSKKEPAILGKEQIREFWSWRKMIGSLVLSKEGPRLTFIHANGYPSGAYQEFLKPLLQEFQVAALSLRPFFPGTNPSRLSDWRDFRDDYLAYLASKMETDSETGRSDSGVIGVGHSVGGMTTLLAAVQRPELFRALVLIEPVIYPPWQGGLMRLASPLKLMRRFHPLLRQTLRRKRVFPSREEMFRNYRNKTIFSRVPDPVLRDYVEGLSRDLPDGNVELRYSPEWETRIYETAGLADRVIWRDANKIQLPVLLIRGEYSDTLKASAFNRLLRLLPSGKGITLAGAGHLLPLETPGRTAAVILDFLHSFL